MGAAYEARLDDDERVAVKVIHPERAGSKTAPERLVREARAAASIDSTHVVQVRAIEKDEPHGVSFIVMDMLQGSDLGQLIARRGALAPVPVVRAFVQARNGLQAAHDRGFVHRDVKPSNLFVHKQASGELTLKVCDFGVAKRAALDDSEDAAKLTSSGGVIGSPMYVSPEQASGSSEVDARSDVWSLGASLYEALSGSPPWGRQASRGRAHRGDLYPATRTARRARSLAPGRARRRDRARDAAGAQRPLPQHR
jgi:serine/threonine-protein kinase